MLAEPGRHGRRDERIGTVHEHAHQEQQQAVPDVAGVLHRPPAQGQGVVVQRGEVDGDGADSAHQGVVQEEEGNGDDEHDWAGGGAHAGAVGDEAGRDAAEDAAVVKQGREGGGLGGREGKKNEQFSAKIFC